MKYSVGLTAALGVLLAGRVAQALPMLSVDVDPATSGIQTSITVVVGSTFSVDVRVDDVSGLFAYDIDVDHNPAVLDATNVTEGPFLASGGTTFFSPDDSSNPVNVVATLLSVVTGVSGSGVLYSIEYSALAPGVSTLEFTLADLADDQQTTIEVGLSGASVTVVERVPVPSTLLMLGIGVAGLVAARRRS